MFYRALLLDTGEVFFYSQTAKLLSIRHKFKPLDIVPGSLAAL